MSNIDFPVEKFDIAISLMTHLYLAEEDFKRSFKTIAEKLTDGGRFIYGNVHPLRILSYKKTNYFKSQILKADLPTLGGKIFSTQFYHHPINLVLNSILNAGLKIKQIYEPRPDNEEVKQYPALLSANDTLPQYLIIDTSK